MRAEKNLKFSLFDGRCGKVTLAIATLIQARLLCLRALYLRAQLRGFIT